jgi:predicted lipoprotein with Yx(FWY)xxD motif
MRRSSAVGPGVLAVAAAAAILLAGCGSSKSSNGSSGSSEGEHTTSTTTTSAAANNTGAASQAVILTKSNPVLETTILAAGPKKLTVYMFAADHGSASACYAACAAAWPPVLTSGSPKAEGGASAAKLGTITRSEGAKQVTYAGHPLYYYTPDSTESDITGQGINSFGALWYVLSPGGQVIKKS